MAGYFGKNRYLCGMKTFGTTIRLVAACVAVMLVAACGRRDRHGAEIWHTGDPEVDNLLAWADRVDEVGDFDSEAIDSLMPVVESIAAQRGDSAMAGMARGTLVWTAGDFDRAAGIFRAAEARVDSARRPYLLARIRLGLSRSLPDDSLERKAALLYEALPTFADAGDSLRVMQTLFDLNVIYGYVWDRGVQASCLGTAAGYVPDSLPVLRALMEANVLGLIRSEADTTAYLHMLDSLRRDIRMTEAVPPLGLMVNTDIYRLRGDTSALDSARRYARITEEGAPGHPALWLYDTYRLRYFVDKNQADSARVYAATLDSLLGDETPYASEMVAELIHYSEWAGDSVGAARLRLALRSLEEAREAYGKGQDMAARSMDPRLSAFIDSPRAGRRDRTPLTVWLIVVAVAASVATVIILVRVRRSRRRPGGKLQEKLEDANRSLAAQQISVIHKENVIRNVLERIEGDGLACDASARAEVLSTLRNAVNGAGEWERFTTLFTQVRPDFTRRLTEAYPALTPGELRLSCLLSIGLDNKQISRLLSIQPDSVKKARQRLRAKLGIPQDESFDTFFSRF